jgi:hypothetical protein
VLPFALLGIFAALLVAVTVLRVRSAKARIRWAIDDMDSATRWVGAIALLPGAGVGDVYYAADASLREGAFLALVSAFGAFIALLGAFGMEGVLLERESEARARLSAGAPPPSTTRGRWVATLLGLALVAGGLAPRLLT